MNFWTQNLSIVTRVFFFFSFATNLYGQWRDNNVI